MGCVAVGRASVHFFSYLIYRPGWRILEKEFHALLKSVGGSYAKAMQADEFQDLAEAAYAALPANFVAAIDNVVVLTDAYPAPDVQQEMQTASPYDLLGLYQGWPLPERGSSYGGHPPDVIHLYREPILAYCRAQGEDVAHCIRHVLIHEIGHYFGFSDEQMEIIELGGNKGGR